MSSVAAPFGLRPVFKSGGTPVSAPLSLAIASAYAANIYQGAPVKIGTTGFIELAAVGERSVGCFLGVEYTPASGRRTYSNYWPTGQVATEIVAYYTRDPQLTYEVQTNAAGTQLMMGQQMDLTTTSAGSSVTGLSTAALDVSSTAANAMYRIVGLAPYPDNAWGDTYAILYVQVSEHQDVADVAAY